jgi:ubiquinol-cytochrome c reductase cytochrome b subunit
MHSTGASAFFICVYLHMFRGLMYGSYRKPRELIWIFGMLIYLCLMAEAFFGYLLPWGQMSYCGAQVIVNLFGSVPFIGEDLSVWIRGDYVVSDATLNRFFAFHVIAVPLVLLGLVAAHILALHEVGSNNPDGVEIKAHKDAAGHPLDGIPFHPYYTVKDLMGVSVFLIVFRLVAVVRLPNRSAVLDLGYPAAPMQLRRPSKLANLWAIRTVMRKLKAFRVVTRRQGI